MSAGSYRSSPKVGVDHLGVSRPEQPFDFANGVQSVVSRR